jgi:hypothetical protein
VRLVIEYWTPVVLWLINIFNFSTDTFEKCDVGLIVGVLSFLFPAFTAATGFLA